jgi:hypothetical protein
LKHIKPDLEDNKAASYAKAVRRDTKELKQELTGESKNHQGDERHDRGPSDNRFPLMVIHTIGHGQENRHRTEWIGQRKKRSET